MVRERSCARWTVWLGLILIGLLLCTPAPADEPPKTLMERMEREMLRFRVQIQNAKVRLELGLVGLGSDENGADQPVTPMRSCCSINLKKIGGAVEALTVVFDELERCHRAADNHGAVSTLGFARNDLKEFARGVQPLADAPTVAEALGVLGGLTRAYIGLLETSEGIEDCVARDESSPEPEAEEGTKKKKKKDRRKKSKEKKKQEADEESGG